ncbi:hypothetical protein FRC16_010400 [Serendipita sp. 398]|nr:hypothetical protein FRC16_010400 [Serendipita sp. 398]
MRLPFFLTLFSLASLFVISAAKIEFIQTPGQIRRCDISEFKWTGSDSPWEFNARLRNETHKYDYEGMITWKNTSFTVITNVPAGWYLSFWVRDWGNPRQTSDSIEYTILDSSRCEIGTNTSTSTGTSISISTTETNLIQTNVFPSIFSSFTIATRPISTSATAAVSTPTVTATTDYDWILSSPAVMVVIPSVGPEGPFASSFNGGKNTIIAVIVIVTLVVISIPIVLLVFCLRRRRQEGRHLPKPLQKVVALSSKIKSEKETSKSNENLVEVEEGLRLNGPQNNHLDSPIPLSATTSRLFETPFSSQAGLVIPSSKELRMRGGAYGTPVPNVDDTMSVSDISAGETFQTDTISVWPTATNAPSETTTQPRRGERQERQGTQERTTPAQASNPNSLFALIGRELEQILQEQDVEGSSHPPSTILETNSSASASPFSDSNGVERPSEVQVNVSPPPPTSEPTSEPIPEPTTEPAPVATPIPPSGKQSLTVSIPTATSVAERLSASPRSGTSRTPISRRDMELLADLVAQRLTRDRRGDGVHSPINEAPPSYS